MIKIHIVSQIIVLKEGNNAKLGALHSDSAFSGPSQLQLFCIVSSYHSLKLLFGGGCK